MFSRFGGAEKGSFELPALRLEANFERLAGLHLLTLNFSAFRSPAEGRGREAGNFTAEYDRVEA